MSSKKRIKTLINILEESNINSMEVSSFWGFIKVKLSKGNLSKSNENIDLPSMNTAPQYIANTENANLPSTPELKTNLESNKEAIDTLEKQSDVSGYIQKAPLVGTVYLSPKPDEDNFVNEGDKIKKGQTICIIEAMKIFNEIEAEKNGTVKKICLQNEDPVEFGQPLIEIISD
tara:strand:+ start:121 stop:642 length:522 start_codon:yes stop_codon:yes gene_type:complete